MARAAIQTFGLTKRYAGRVAVSSLDISVTSGRLTGFVGPNGAGKTTTIRMLLGLIRPTEGSAVVLDQRVGSGSAALQHVGAMVDGPAFYPALSGRDNLRVLTRLGKIERHRIDETLEIVGLTERAADRVSSYSLGMRQRLGIAAALLPRPGLVMLDEPTNGLDPAGIQDIRKLLRDLADQGVSILVSSHQLAELEHVCDDLILLRQGAMIYQGPMADLLQQNTHRVIGRPELPDQLPHLVNAAESCGFPAWVEDRAVVVDAPSEWASQFNRIAAGKGITLSALWTESPSLEEIFFRLTAREEQS